MKPDLVHAEEFLKVLAGDSLLTFQTFNDNQERKDRSLTRVLHGQIEDQLENLSTLNTKGAGIFVMVNQGDGKGRKSKNIAGIRAVFVDLDENGAKRLEKIKALPEGAHPHMIVESSPGKYHAYWLVEEGIPPHLFSGAQKKLAEKFGGDPAVCDPPRVMRVPGFIHRKGEPFITRLVETRNKAALPASLFLPKSQAANFTEFAAAQNESFMPVASPSVDVKQLKQALSFIDAESYGQWIDIGMALHHDLREGGLDLWLEWSQKAANFDEGACREKWLNFGSQNDRAPLTSGTIYHLAKEAGWIRTKEENLTDTGNAQRFARYFGDAIKYVPEFNKWLIWDTTRWLIDDTGAIWQLAKKTTQQLQLEAQKLTDEKRVSQIKYALASESLQKLKAMVTLTQSEPGIPLHQTELDKDPLLLNTQNGVINLTTGAMRPHTPLDYLTKKILVRYQDQGSTCPLWLSFLDRVMASDHELIGYLQRAVGYSLTGDTREQCLFFLYGTGANGKSTFLNILRALLNDYAMQTSSETLMVKQVGNGATPDLARLRGARMVISSETEDGQRFAESTIKQLTGQDTITARHLYAPLFEYRPSFKLWLAGNHRPAIRGTDPAIWRRIHLIPFNVTIPPEERDKTLEDKLRQELPGILKWAIDGCLSWQHDGLCPPDEVKAATDDYRNDMDTIGHWLSECCEFDRDATAGATELYSSYKAWASTNGYYPLSHKRLGTALSERGLAKKKAPHVVWHGIKPINSEFATV